MTFLHLYIKSLETPQPGSTFKIWRNATSKWQEISLHTSEKATNKVKSKMKKKQESRHISQRNKGEKYK